MDDQYIEIIIEKYYKSRNVCHDRIREMIAQEFRDAYSRGLSIDELAQVTHISELYPVQWAPKDVDTSEPEEGMFTCTRCSSKRCKYKTLQTRSADEGETVFVHCLDCGLVFRI